MIDSTRLAILILLFLSPPLLADDGVDQHQLLDHALQELDSADMDGRWQFTMTVQQDDELRVVHHNPERDGYEQRHLISIDGKPPAKKQLKKFQKEERKRMDERDPATSGYGHLVDLETLELVDTSEGVARYAFSPRIPALEKEVDKLAGEILFNTNTGKIDQISISNAQSMSPAFSVTLEHYRLVFHFIQEQGTRLLQKMESEARGKLGFLKKFNSITNIKFSDYQPVSVDS